MGNEQTGTGNNWYFSVGFSMEAQGMQCMTKQWSDDVVNRKGD
jgi:hypothetical protein